MCPMCLQPSAGRAWKPTGTRASPVNFHSTHTEKTGGVTTGHDRRPTTACCWEEKGPFPFTSLPQTQTGSPLPLLLCPHPPRALPALAPPSCSTRHQPTKAAEETLRYFFPPGLIFHSFCTGRAAGRGCEECWPKGSCGRRKGENGNSLSVASLNTVQHVLCSHT